MMLGLKLATDPRWVNIAEKSIEEILTDHAWCEQKAASTCISIIVQFPEKTAVVESLTAIVAEEWGHFRKVLKEIEKRGYRFGRARNDNYVNELQQLVIKAGNRDAMLVEKLLVCAMIEARSCERFRLLSLHISEQSLKEFYHEFMMSEAGHYRTFIDLAKLFMPEDHVTRRWKQICEGEAWIMERMAVRGDRIH
jgi:tRNA-(ms[2]io[6]A)-hydroxylase